ncbi:hypothetical protein JCGZ_12745 [Jatropha curcas]|uniref:Uncharacterized protein n=1 Tax=Jatropha curcas TaxID=180498 RepID=A0A067KE31_JATCU|nr:hypothetical protein JCGZ_12745 [Jatropha curcas]
MGWSDRGTAVLMSTAWACFPLQKGRTWHGRAAEHSLGVLFFASRIEKCLWIARACYLACLGRACPCLSSDLFPSSVARACHLARLGRALL